MSSPNVSSRKGNQGGLLSSLLRSASGGHGKGEKSAGATTTPHSRAAAAGGGGNGQNFRRFIPLLVPLLVLLFLFILYANADASKKALPLSPSLMSTEDAGNWNESWTVLVAHDTPLTNLDAAQLELWEADKAKEVVLRREQLPSWTMHVVDPDCAECLDKAGHAAALPLELKDLKEDSEIDLHDAAQPTVFATPKSVMGLTGPMLFAMASVTDDVDVKAELPKWSWLTRSYQMRRAFSHPPSTATPASGAAATATPLSPSTKSPYLVVMGLPSTDQPVRAALRRAQRATWLSYSEVARNENNFNGALLPLYIFAAAEPAAPTGKVDEASRRVSDVTPLYPTLAEYEAASSQLLVNGTPGYVVPSYQERRVKLVLANIAELGSGDARLTESPCQRVASREVGGRGPSAISAGNGTWTASVAGALNLPATPAFAAPAQFICHASAALWQEALTHRNVVWVDMMTDRRPRVARKMNQQKSWGLPIEVAMTQKLVLWLNYAYNAFPDVPYIMKNDDDTYLKVPQFLRDVRFVRSGFQDAFPAASPAERDPAGVEKTEDCIYWGRLRTTKKLGHLHYHGGMGYFYHRRMVQATMELTNELNVKAVKLAVTPFHADLTANYREIVFQFEDCFGGRIVRDKRQRMREICPQQRSVVIDEVKERVADAPHTHNAMGYAALLVHHVTPVDIYFLHYYFQHEKDVADAIATQGTKAEAKAEAAAKEWIQTHMPGGAAATRGSKLLPFMWQHPKDAPNAQLSTADNVYVYNVSYHNGPAPTLDMYYRSRVA